MLNYVWAAIIVLSIVYSLATGNVSKLNDSVFTGLESAVSLLLTMTGIICFWSGLMKIAERSGLTNIFAKSLKPITKALFPNLSSNSPAIKAISMNMSANMLGLGSAATPLGLKAMKELKNISPLKDRASDDMIMFVVINTASIQLLPTGVAAFRMKFGSLQPFDVLPAVWISSVCSLLVGVMFVKVLSKYGR